MSGGDLGEGAGGPATAPPAPRVARLEASVGHIERASRRSKRRGALRVNARGDFGLPFGANISVALGLAAIMAKGFHRS